MEYEKNYALFLWVLREFQRRGLTEILVVYDCDDLMWALMDVVSRRLGINYERLTAVFKIRDNPWLTHEEKEAVFAAFADPSFFDNIQFFPGTEDILRVMELGAKVGVNSNAFNRPVGERKKEQLLAKIPGLKPEQIQMNIICESQAGHKVFNPTTTVFHDDSPHNVILSPAIIDNMPRWMAWSRNPQAVQDMANHHKTVRWHPDLRAMNQFTYNLVEFMVKGGALNG